MINDKYTIRLYYLELLMLAFLLPIYRKVIPYVIAAIVITWLLEGDFPAKSRRIAQSLHRQQTLLFAGIYILYFIGLAYTEYLHEGLFNLEVKLSLFIFPVLMASMRKEVLSLKIARDVLIAFVFGVLAAMLLSFTLSGIEYLDSGATDVFYYSLLSSLIHPSYMAMYVCFAIAILLYFLWKRIIYKRFWRVLSVLLVIMFQFFIVMLSSKAGILGLVVTLVLFTTYAFIAERVWLRALASGTFLMGSFVLLFLLFPGSAHRFAETREVIGQAEINADEIANSSGERIMIWWYTFEITNDHFLAGVGTGDVRDHLLEKYREKKMHYALQLQLNAHNQYLQTMIALGVVGLVVLLLNLVLPAFWSMDRRHYLYLIFLVLIAFNFLFESMLETQAGVVFYAFFNAYLFAIKKDPASIEAGPC